MTAYASAGNQSAAEAVHAELVHFVEMDLPSGYLRLHTRTGTLAIDGNNYTGIGQLGSISDVGEDAMLRPQGVTFTLSGVDAALITAARTEAYHGRTVTVYRGFLNVTTLALVATPEVAFRGIMDKMSIELGQGSGSITVSAEGELARWQRHSGLLYSSESQREIYPSDKGFDNVPIIQQRSVNWSKLGDWGRRWMAAYRAGT